MALGEFDWIDRLRKAFPQASGEILGIGDDCAVLPFSALSRSAVGEASGDELLVSTDLLTEGVHFRLEDITPWQLGWKSLAVNISDIAAMGGTPKGFFLSIAFPGPDVASASAEDKAPQKRLDEAWMDEYIRGLKDIAEQYGVALLGGDTSRSIGPLTLNITIVGTCAKGTSVKRSSVRPGDLICVSGTLGDSAAGLKALLENIGTHGANGSSKGEVPAIGGALSRLIRRHFEPQPRVALGQTLAAMPDMGAMMDLSDGLAADLPHILDASSQGASLGHSQAPLGAVVETAKIPLSDDLRAVCSEYGWDPLSLALEGGEDYELLFTCRPDAPLERTLRSTASTPAVTVIGRVTDTPGIIWKGSDRSYHGFRHF